MTHSFTNCSSTVSCACLDLPSPSPENETSKFYRRPRGQGPIRSSSGKTSSEVAILPCGFQCAGSGSAALAGLPHCK